GDVLRLPRGGRLVLSRPQGRLADLLPAVLARVAPLLEEHGRVATGVIAALEPAARRGAGEPAPGAVEPGADLPRRPQLDPLHSRPRLAAPQALLRALDALQH